MFCDRFIANKMAAVPTFELVNLKCFISYKLKI